MPTSYKNISKISSTFAVNHPTPYQTHFEVVAVVVVVDILAVDIRVADMQAAEYYCEEQLPLLSASGKDHQ